MKQQILAELVLIKYETVSMHVLGNLAQVKVKNECTHLKTTIIYLSVLFNGDEITFIFKVAILYVYSMF